MAHQNSWGSAFAAGLKKHGVDAHLSETYSRADLVVMWSVRREDTINLAKREECEVCILERGYVGDRLNWTSVSFGGRLNGRAEFRGPLTDGSRWKENFSDLMKPWREEESGAAIIMGQTPGDMSVKNVSLPSFYERASREFQRLGLKTRLRQHPNIAKSRPLEMDLSEARCAITWNSNSGVDAVLAGVPTVAMDQGSMAWNVAGHSFAMPPKPDRRQWANALAWKQFSKEEMTSGFCWDTVKG